MHLLLFALRRLVALKRLALLVGLMLGAHLALAASPAFIPGTETSLLESQATGKTYRISVFVPEAGPKGAPEAGYPVIYVLDGLWHFARVQSLASALVFDGQMPQAIIVAIDYSTTLEEVLKLRQHDLTLGEAADPGPSGNAPAFLQFLTSELAPWVEKNHRANSADRTLAGHSYAGHFALYAWAAKPGFYGRVLAASPYWNRALEDFLASGATAAPADAASRLDVSSGLPGLEYADCVVNSARAHVVHAARSRLAIAGETRFALYPNLKHAAIAHPIYAHGLPWLFTTDSGTAETLAWSPGLAAVDKPGQN